MTGKPQPDKFDWATELSDAQGHVTLSAQEAHEIGARLRSMGAKLKTYEELGDAADDMQLLRMGYAAARLEIESLRAAQPAGAQQPGAAYAALTYKQVLGSKNCMQCCVSYMLGLPLESVPDFATDGGWELFSDFAESQGYAAVMLPGNREFEADYLASGTTERGTSHMVVMNDGKLVHDPHPSNVGLVDVQCVWLLAKRATPRTVQADEHAEFETAAKAYTSNVSFERAGTGYADMTAELLWHGWKLRASHGQAPAQPVVPAFTEAQIASACLSYRHDFGLLGETDRKSMMWIARQWERAFAKEREFAAPAQPAPYEIINMAREQGLPETETEGVFRVNVDDLGRIFASYRAARAPADSVLEDAARYRFLAGHCRSTAEHWGGRWSIIIDGPAPKSHDSEDDFDAAVDAVRKQGAKHDNT